MDPEALPNPSFSELVKFASGARSAGRLLTIYARCSVKYTGHREGQIGKGDRIIICKPDGAVAVHRPTGARAIARQAIGSTFETIELDDCLRLFASKGGTETIRVDIFDASLAVRCDAVDEATLEQNQTEEQMHSFILSNPGAIEDGFRILEHERSTPYGRIDFYGADKDGNNVVIEVKQPIAKLPHVDQLQRYLSHYQSTDSASVRGVLVAPAFKNKVKRTLRDTDLEWVRLNQFQKHTTSPHQASIDDWD